MEKDDIFQTGEEVEGLEPRISDKKVPLFTHHTPSGSFEFDFEEIKEKAEEEFGEGYEVRGGIDPLRFNRLSIEYREGNRAKVVGFLQEAGWKPEHPKKDYSVVRVEWPSDREGLIKYMNIIERMKGFVESVYSSK